MINNFPLKDYGTVNALHADHGVKHGQPWIFNENFDNQVNYSRKLSLKNWWTGVLYHSKRHNEVSAMLFWINYFYIQTNKFTNAIRVYRHLENIRSFALLNYRDMLAEMILNQTIVHFARKVRPADETLMESILRIILEQYIAGPEYLKYISKEKLKRLKKLLNEWDLICDTLMLSSRNQQKDQRPDIHSFMHTSRVQAYLAELTVFLERLFQSMAVARHVAKKMFVWRNNIEHLNDRDNEIINNLAESFAGKNYSIEALLEEVDIEHGEGIITPTEYVFDFVNKHDNLPVHDSNSIMNYPYYEWLRLQIAQMGQETADVPEGLGWTGYSLCPAQKIWLSPVTMQERTRQEKALLHGPRRMSYSNL
jgi:hypothetical protein